MNVRGRVLPRIASGSILDPAALSVLQLVARDASPRGVTTLRRLLPSLQSVEHLMPLVWDVLDGSPRAAEMLRGVMLGFARGAEQTQVYARVVAAFDEEREPCDCKGPATPARSHPLAPPERMLPLLAALVVAARSPTDLARMFGALELGLAGLLELTRIYDAGRAPDDRVPISLSWDIAVRNARGRFGAEPGFGEPGFPEPGFPDPDFPPEPFPEPGAPGGPLPDPIPPPRDPSRGISMFDAFEICVQELLPRMRARGFGPRATFPTAARGRWNITSITPDHGCANAVVEIAGTGFDGTRHVHFTGATTRPVAVVPTSVSSTRIVVTVPPEARTGPVTLDNPETVMLCHELSITFARPGTPGMYTSDVARIAWFATDAACAVLGRPSTLHWGVEPDGVEVVIHKDGVELFRGVGPTGEIPVDTSALGTQTFTMEATNPGGACGTETATAVVEVEGPAPILTVVAVEVTQGIQIFNLADPGHADNNSLRMIDGKDTIVRVFVTSDRGGFAGDTAMLSGMLRLRGVAYMPVNSSPFITVGMAPNRALVDDSLNFRIPAAAARGMGQALDIFVFSPDGCPHDASARHVHHVDWHDLPPFPVTIRRVAESDGTVLSEGAALALIERAFLLLPTSTAAVRLYPGVFQIDGDTTEDNYCHDGGYYALAQSIAYEHNDTEGYGDNPHETKWIGLYPRTGCTAGGMMAWPFTSTCISEPTNDVAAHELCHCIGMGHTVTSAGERCDDIGQPVGCHHLPNNGVLGEIVFDLFNNATVTTSSDLMSYASGYRMPHPLHWEDIRDRITDFVAAVTP